jgi:hypothetical protein
VAAGDVKAVKPKTAFLDIRFTGNGVMDSLIEAAALKELGGALRVHRGGERKIVSTLVRGLEKYDLLVFWGGEVSPIALLTAKALHHGVDPSPIHMLMHLEVKQFVEQNLGIHNPDLEKTARFLKARKSSEKTKTLENIFRKLLPLLKTTRPELAL